MTIWQTLGIPQTTDQKEIKKAYAARVKSCHREEKPEEWAVLHDAYQRAIQYAKRQEKESDLNGSRMVPSPVKPVAREGLKERDAALEKENDRLRADYDTLYAAVDAQSKKLRFMDSYVVFIEDDGTGNYHRYDCGKFSKKNFWAYSRKLAERQGYTPCAQCFGR